ncbi:hypothetical protein [Streptomyces sp. NPDC002133]|uniref:hypothetical protein n=1 Tax=Streptomyces sp. NPDC002133 TaxID=3154409 RepID=UPI00331BC405
MSRRVSLPGADELFRTTGGTALQSSSPRRGTSGANGANGEARVPAQADEPSPEEHSPAEEETGTAEPRSRGASAEGEPGSATAAATAAAAAAAKGRSAAPAASAAGAAPRRRGGRGANRRPSGRERHDEKITVYVSAEELMDLEHARLVLRGEHGLAVDRGRIVREAVAVVLADLESRGDASILVRRLRGR